MPLKDMLINWSRFRRSGQVGDEYYDHEYRWGMTIDLDKCTGCSACVTACYAENNLPVVGKQRFSEGLAMHWLRIERYWDEGDGRGHPADSTNEAHSKDPGNNNQAPPEARFPEQSPEHYPTRFPEQGAQQIPMLCQQCEHAPCEPVCPVAATYHTHDGLNAQVYNRCIGSRYCSNNCPYKVRYFNFYSYTWDSPLEQQLNTDISVRDKGVMEKCTFCVQRIRSAQNTAKNDNRMVQDGEVQTACQQACPSQAIVFGNLEDPDSRVAASWRTHKIAFGHLEKAGVEKLERGYRVFEDLNTEPSITYLERVRDTEV
jgi:molybdopterin-containing oxidoreductase family iron-sulfur binding subunit